MVQQSISTAALGAVLGIAEYLYSGIELCRATIGKFVVPPSLVPTPGVLLKKDYQFVFPVVRQSSAKGLHTGKLGRGSLSLFVFGFQEQFQLRKVQSVERQFGFVHTQKPGWKGKFQ